MKFQFFVRFYTRPGQYMKICGSLPGLGGGDFAKAIRMQYQSDQFWQLILETPDEEMAEFPVLRYRYIYCEEGKEDFMEWKDDRSIDLSLISSKEIHTVDTWNHPGEYENVFSTSPFSHVLLNSSKSSGPEKSYRGISHVFRVKCPLLEKNEMVCLLGGSGPLKTWDVLQPLLLHKQGDWWQINLNLTNSEFPITYKYGIYNKKEKTFVRFEFGENRTLYRPPFKQRITFVHDGFVHLPNNTWRGTGVAIPVFSLRSKKSMGSGEFTDLRLLTDWASATGLRVIQLLPVNDTISTHTWVDSYPYAAISAFALHPLYINLEQIAGKAYAPLLKPYRKKQQALNDLPEVDYEAVMNIKLGILSELYPLMKADTFADESYQEFFKANKHWLVPYAAFSYLRDKYNSADTEQWKTHTHYDEKAIQKLCAPSQKHYDKIAIHFFIQFHLHRQLKEAHDYANQQGIILKGDIPIGINRLGSDAWTEPHWYDMNVQAGAPPDDFAIKGQNWGFPTYNWEEMQKDGYLWWKLRFEQMSTYFDAFRIDHILGFFRIWSIPIHAVEGILGHFVPAIPVHRNEFSERGIWFDHTRYCTPFINDQVLWELFGPNEKKFKPFLEISSDQTYQLKPEFHTQRQVEAFFSTQEINEDNRHIQQGLYDLISNVILFEDSGPVSGKFHFRFNAITTSSFRHLDDHLRAQLHTLYIDYFYRRQDDFWEHEAMKKLPALKRSTNMLICGEDLGMVPHCVPDVMQTLGILSLEIQRMPKNTNTMFFHPANAPYLSVVTPSTHDMSTIRGWWEEDREKTQRFYNDILGKYGVAPLSCDPTLNREILIQHLHSPAQWCIFQLQDILGIDGKLRRINPMEERINIPANPRHYWCYRMHISLEDLLKEKSFNEDFKHLIEAAGR